MEFKIWLESIGLVNNLQSAMDILGVRSGDSEEIIKQKWRNASLKNHPDRGGDPERQKEVNAAFDYLKDHGLQTTGRHSYSEPRTTEPRRSSSIPPWQTDERSAYNEVGNDFSNINYCKKSIYEKAIRNGEVEKWTILSFDGYYFRSLFEIFCNRNTLDYAGEVMEVFNHSASYATYAIFAHKEKSRVLRLIRLKKRPLADKDITMIHHSFNFNPGNDTEFMSSISSRLEEIEKSLVNRE